MTDWAVVPTWNERECLPALVGRLRAAAPGLRILVVDDDSPDGTGELALELGRELGGVELLRRTGRGGLASAYVDGFRRALDAGADRVVQMDADGSHRPEDVPRLLETDADLVLGSRYVPGGSTPGWPWRRELLSRFGSVYARLWLGLPHRDLTGGFKAWRRGALEAALAEPLRSEGYAFQVEMTLRAARAGASVTEVPIVFPQRVAGSSKMSGRIALEAALLVPRLRRRGGYRGP